MDTNRQAAHNRKDETGNRYGRLVVARLGRTRGKAILWECLCDCGVTTYVRSGDLRRKDDRAITMCVECGKKAGYKHGHTAKGGYQSPTYVSWHSMINRCKSDPRYMGIEIDPDWMVFSNFLRDMGERPSNKHSIDRKDGSKGYFKSNCRWATHQEQSRNMRTNVWVTLNGTTKLLKDWNDELGIDVGTYYDRIRRGMTPEEALTAPKYVKTSDHKAKLSEALKKLGDQECQLARTLHSEGASFSEIGRRLGVSATTIARVCGRKY